MEASRNDPFIQELKQIIETNEWWKVTDKKYLLAQNDLIVLGDCILRGDRLLIPESLRQRIVEIAHEGHQGIVNTKKRLRAKVWWPGVDADAEKFCKSCHGCQVVTKASKPEPMTRTELPPGKWQDIAADFMGPLPYGHYLLVVVDYYSRYYETKFMRKITTEKLIDALEDIFTIHGLPVTFTSDNGPQLTSDEFEEYLEYKGIEHRKVTPEWAEANGEVERQN